MRVPISWLKDYVDITIPLEDLASKMTMAGLEVDSIQLVGLPIPPRERHEFKITGLSWQPDKIVVAAIHEVMPHPNADRLVLCRLDDGLQEHVVLTGAPNLFEYKGKGKLDKPLKVAYAREGAEIYDGHQPGQVLTTLKRAKIRGFESYSMVCSEKELGFSDEHEGIMFLEDDAPTGMPLVDFMGDAVFEISITPNMIRNACVIGVAREIAALTGQKLRLPEMSKITLSKDSGPYLSIKITDPELNPRFVAGLIRDVEIRPSPLLIQRRLRLAGMRPISNIVDATNYVMLEFGEPLHAFDYDVLVKRVAGKVPTIITRTAEPGEKVTTLDGVERTLDPFTVLVCDSVGSLSIAGVMGGAESEVSDHTRNILLEGASWNFINIRKTVASQRLPSEAAYRMSRGIPPALALIGEQRCLDMMKAWGGGSIEPTLVDCYPKPAEKVKVSIQPQDVARILGITLTPAEIAGILIRLEFVCEVQGDTVLAEAPDQRMDIGTGITGKADVLEEIARIYGYDLIPEEQLADTLPPQRRNVPLEREEALRDLCARLGLQEIVTYRLTAPEREDRLLGTGEREYLRLANPITPERCVMRQSVLASILEILEKNIRLRDRFAFFEIGPAFFPHKGQPRPDEPKRLAIVMTGHRFERSWDKAITPTLDFFDLKGIVEGIFDGLHLAGVTYEVLSDHPLLHPGKTAQVSRCEKNLGWFGELHPLVKKNYHFNDAPILVAELDLDTLFVILGERQEVESVPAFPPVFEDIAVVVDEGLAAGNVEDVIWKAGGKMLTRVQLFDIFRGDQIGSGKKSLAYNLTYQSSDRTLTDEEAAQVRRRIVKQLEQELGAKLRS